MIYILGAGAIGKALAVFLKLAGKEVLILRGSVDDGSSRTENIQVVLHDSAAVEATIAVSTLRNFSRLDGMVVLTNKSYGNEALSRALRGKTPHSPLVLLQNGLGIERVFMDRGFAGIYRCVLFITSQVMAGGRIRFKPVSVSPVGIIQGNPEGLQEVVEQLHTPYFPFKAEPAIQAVIWKKAIVNSVFNSVCPLLETDNGIFHRNEAALDLARRIIAECVAVAQASGVSLDAAGVLDSLLTISRLSDGQLISTLQDIQQKRRTEIETLNLEIARIAQSLDMADRVPETRLLGALTKLKSDLNLY